MGEWIMAIKSEPQAQQFPAPSERDMADKLKEWGISQEEFDRLQALRLDRESRIAPVGATAPDFELELLPVRGDRSGKTVRLSSLRGKPVALAFGSYT